MKKNLAPLIIKTSVSVRAKKIIFLDRDGVINRFPGVGAYVTSMKQFSFIPGALRAIKLLTKNGFEINVVSNQGCVARKLITAKELLRLTGHMIEKVRGAGGEISGVYYCIHQMSDGCRCKKPNTTLLKKAIARRKIALSKIYFIGDSKEDMLAAKRLKCKALLVLSGRTKKKDMGQFEPKPDIIKKNLLEAAQWITKKRS